MRRWTPLLLAFSFLAGCLILALAPGRPSLGQQVASPPGEVGRYRVSYGTSSHTSEGTVIVIDSLTGECWTRPASRSTPWKSLGSPVEKRGR